jgi:hypothetical protein
MYCSIIRQQTMQLSKHAHERHKTQVSIAMGYTSVQMAPRYKTKARKQEQQFPSRFYTPDDDQCLIETCAMWKKCRIWEAFIERCVARKGSRKPRIWLQGSVALTSRHPLSAKIGTNFVAKRLSLGRYSSLAGSCHWVCLFVARKETGVSDGNSKLLRVLQRYSSRSGNCFLLGLL